MSLPNDLISPKTAARLLSVHVATIYRLVSEGKLPALRRAGTRLLVRRVDVEALLTPVVPAVPVPSAHALRREQIEAEEALRAAGLRF
jgi:excisionase family DNA binding protein